MTARTPWWRQHRCAGQTPEPAVAFKHAWEQTADELAESIALFEDVLARPEVTDPFLRTRLANTRAWLIELYDRTSS
jgi:hypothetical protein